MYKKNKLFVILSDDERASLSSYINTIRIYPFLTKEEENSCFRDYKKGSKSASDKLINSHLRLVVKIAITLLKNKKSSIMELIQEGSQGLIEALKNFDPKEGRFGALAHLHIYNKILRRIIQDGSIVSIPESAGKRKAFYNLNKIKNRLKSNELSHSKGLDFGLSKNIIDEIKSELKINENDIIFMNQRMNQGDQSLNDLISIDGNKTEKQDLLEDKFYDNFISVEDFYINKIENLKINKIKINKLHDVISTNLNEREREIIKRRYLNCEKENLTNIGKLIGISAERVRQIEKSAFLKLKKNLNYNLKLAS